MAERQTGFEMRFTPEEFGRIGCVAISRLAGIPLKEVIPSEVAAFHRANVELQRQENPSMSPFAYMRLAEKYKPHGVLSKRAEAEKHQSIGQASELVGDGETTLNSYGLFAPSYERELEIQKKAEGDAPYRSLLVGAYTIDTAVEYTATVRNVFPQAQTYVMDIEGIDTAQKPGFLFGNGLAIPFKAGTFSSIHTNYLLHMLEGPKKDPRLNVNNFFREAVRVLAPGGKLIMCEGNLGKVLGTESPYESLMQIGQMLSAFGGFSGMEMKPALMYKNRREMVRHFRSTHGARKEGIEEDLGLFIIVATKR